MARHITCQSLLNGDPLKYGWLRRQDFIHQKVKLNLVKIIRWPKVFVVIDDCFLYMYNNEQSERPSKFIHLFYATDVLTKFDMDTSECPWSFALVNQATHKGTTYIFAAASQKEMTGWVDALKDQLKLAKERGTQAAVDQIGSHNLKSDDSDDDDDEDYCCDKIQDSSLKFKCNRALPRLPPGAQQVMPCTSKKPKGPSLKPLAPVAAQLGSDDDDDGDIEYTDMRNVGPRPPVTSSKKQRPDVSKKPSMVVLPRVVRPGAKREPEEEHPYELGLSDEDVVAAAMWTRGAKEGHDLISNCAEDGVYLLRESIQCLGQQTLVSHVGGMAKKYKIGKLGPGRKQFTLDVSEPNPRCFASMSQLVRHYMKEPLPSPDHKVCLSKPFSELTN